MASDSFSERKIPARRIISAARLRLVQENMRRLDLPIIATVESDGADFGANGRGFVRLNSGCPRATLDAALERMATALPRP